MSTFAATESVFTIHVLDFAAGTPENPAPVIADPGNKTYQRGAAITAFPITVTNTPETDTLTVSVAGLPSGLAYATTTGQVSGTVSATAALQSYTITVTADDGVNAAVTRQFTITIQAATTTPPPTPPPTPNRPPVVSNPGTRTVQRGSAISPFSVTSTDADGDELQVQVTGLPDGLAARTTGSAGNYSTRFSGTVSASSATGNFTVRVTANDGALTVTRDFVITVTAAPPPPPPENRAPVIAAVAAKSYEQGENITAFSVGVTDADGDDLTIQTTGLPTGLSAAVSGQSGNYTVRFSGRVNPTATAQTYAVTITADDGTAAAVTRSFNITVTAAAVTPTNRAPVIVTSGNRTARQGETITAFAVRATDLDRDALTVRVTGLPAGLSASVTRSLDSSTLGSVYFARVSGTVSQTASARAYTVNITANDGTVTSRGSFIFTVTAAPTPPPPTNRLPTITVPTSTPTWTMGRNISIITIPVRDLDGDRIDIRVTGLPDTGIIGPADDGVKAQVTRRSAGVYDIYIRGTIPADYRGRRGLTRITVTARDARSRLSATASFFVNVVAPGSGGGGGVDPEFE